MRTESQDDATSIRDVLQDITFGGIAGMVSEVCEYPFDVVKTRLQAQLLGPSTAKLRFSGPIDCIRQTFRDEGIRGLYRGIPAPIAGSMVETAALFVSYTFFQTSVRNYTGNSDLSIPQLALAGGGAGFATSFIVTPIELVKCKMQVQMMNLPTPVRNPPIGVPNTKLAKTLSPPGHFISLDARRGVPGAIPIIKSIIANGPSGLWLGHTGTILRETGGSAAWFACKEFFAQQLRARRTATIHGNVRDEDLLPWESAVSGAIAGAACVLALYPADTVKSAVQTLDELRPSSEKPASTPTFFRTLRSIYVSHGLRGLYAGCGMTMLRAVPGSGIVFVVYDGLSQWAK